MNDEKAAPQNIDAYIAGFSGDVRDKLEMMRTVIRETAPEAEEKISYQMPTFTYQGRNLVHFAAFKNHIGFYPTPSGIEQFKEELSKYKRSKGAVQFPIDQPIPYDLVRKITAFRVKENLERAEAKRKKK